MRHFKLEKNIIKIDRDIQALTLAKRYLSNTEEIETIKTKLNKERQQLVEELYSQDTASRYDCIEIIKPLLNQELHHQQQLDLLEEIKENFGRRFPEVSKESHGLKAWLKALDVTCEWTQNKDSDWAILVMTAIVPKKVN